MLANVKKEEKGGVQPQNTESPVSAVSISGLDRLYDRLQGSLALSTVEQKSAQFNAELDKRAKTFDEVVKKVEADVKRWQQQKQAEEARVQDLLKLMGDII